VLLFVAAVANAVRGYYAPWYKSVIRLGVGYYTIIHLVPSALGV